MLLSPLNFSKHPSVPPSVQRDSISEKAVWLKQIGWSQILHVQGPYPLPNLQRRKPICSSCFSATRTPGFGSAGEGRSGAGTRGMYPPQDEFVSSDRWKNGESFLFVPLPETQRGRSLWLSVKETVFTASNAASVALGDLATNCQRARLDYS